MLFFVKLIIKKQQHTFETDHSVSKSLSMLAARQNCVKYVSRSGDDEKLYGLMVYRKYHVIRLIVRE